MKLFHLIIYFVLLCSSITSCQAQKKPVTPEDWQAATSQVVKRYSPSAHSHLHPYFKKAGISFPPKRVALLAFKKEQRVELWAGEKDKMHYIKDYPLKAKSGGPGPKLVQNDRQIPEGIYKIITFNPYSSLHLSMKLNYPNEFDRHFARLDGRRKLGDNIFIHGKAKSAGCLAIGDKAIEELFVLVANVGKHNTDVIIAPNDLRIAAPVKAKDKNISWQPILHAKISQALQPFKQEKRFSWSSGRS